MIALGSRPPRPKLDRLVVIPQALAIGFLAWAVLEQSPYGPLLHPGYFDQYLVSGTTLVAGVLFGAV